ncbi:MAG: preprotein translocase subunit SecG [Porticoccaceae bacterium]|jgi:preprotein translocase subunit SecG|nr:preprotein translocase subunit SecG [Porticoccaceae bacterium]MEA3298773.1 preprotein translocase subunit SecG [Pseudomonadota bacterium]HLS99087.1 preprotein translocase subunit SecG [Porticoccaceae bacterium]
MMQIILAIHLLIALAIVALVLLQQGKGAEAGASFGAGASQTIFGSSGSWNFFSKATAILATLFFVTSFTLAVMAKHKAGMGDSFIPDVGEEIPASVLDGDIPVAPQDEAALEVPAVPEVPAGREQ